MNTELSQCKGGFLKYTHALAMDNEARLTLLKRILPKCSPWSIASNTMSYLGAGSYGSVYNVVLKKGGHKKNVALKVIMLGEKDTEHNKRIQEETIEEIKFGHLMDKVHIGPKIYDEFLYEDTGKKVGVVFILMEKFLGSGSEFLDNRIHAKGGPLLSLNQKESIILKMMKLARKMISNNLYCWDVKPSNFVVNSLLKVRMIDFGGQFCMGGVEFRMNNVNRLRDGAKQLIAFGLDKDNERRAKTITKISVEKFDELFYYLIMLPFLWIIYEMDKYAEIAAKRRAKAGIIIRGEPRWVSFLPVIRKVAQPILRKVCHNDTLRMGLGLFLAGNPVIFKTFSHYTHAVPKTSGTTAVVHFNLVLHELCFYLLGTPKKTRRRSRRKTSRRKKVNR